MTYQYDDIFAIGERAIHEDETAHGKIGTVVKVGRKWIYLRLDGTGKIQKFDPDDLQGVADNAGHSDATLYAWLKQFGHSEKAIRDWYPGFRPPRMTKKAVAELFESMSSAHVLPEGWSMNQLKSAQRHRRGEEEGQ